MGKQIDKDLINRFIGAIIVELNLKGIINESPINTNHVGKNGLPIYIYKDYFLHFTLWKNNHIDTYKLPKWFIEWCRNYLLSITIRSDKPNIELKDSIDKNAATRIFQFAGNNSPFLKCNPKLTIPGFDNLTYSYYDCTPYMQEEKLDRDIIEKFKSYLKERGKI